MNPRLIQPTSKHSFEDKQAKKKEGTRKAYKSMLNKFEKYCITVLDDHFESLIDDLLILKKENSELEFKNIIYEKVLNPYLSYLTREGIKRRTQTMYFSAVNTYLNHRGISLNDKDNRDNLDFITQQEDELYALTIEDIQRIFTVIPSKKKYLYYALLSTGCRPSELLQVRKKDLSFEQDRIRIKILSMNTKTSRARSVYLTKEAGSFLMPNIKHISDNDLVFTKNPNTKDVVTKEGILFGTWLDKIGYDERYESNNRRKITMYSFRSYFFGVCADVNREAYAHRMTGHGGYLPQYDRWDNEKKLEAFLKVEPLLTVSDEDKIKLERESIKEEKKIIQEQQNELEEGRKENESIKRDLEDLKLRVELLTASKESK
ncbi:MAG: tyrosine-type recombinase/integrase [Nitrosopumilus sp.]|nr:tyrosine-type recombinase/integrase [Nitrosopumilus sp.]